MSYIKADTKKEQEYFDFLEDLRQRGSTNMYGASPYLQKAFAMPKDKAVETLSRWMRLHDDKSRILEGPSTRTRKSVEFRTVAEISEEDR